jgi:hypothetical protein
MIIALLFLAVPSIDELRDSLPESRHHQQETDVKNPSRRVIYNSRSLFLYPSIAFTDQAVKQTREL